MADEPKKEQTESTDPPNQADLASPADIPAKQGFPLVGIGASAGGLEALEEFLRHTPADSGMAFVIISHHPVGHTSLLPELLAKHTNMPVQQVTTSVEVEPNHVYVSQPGTYLTLHNFTLQPKSANQILSHLQFPIDYFFRSLAEDQKDKAICIILSGTGTDGTLGLQAIKGAAGMTMVQDEQSAQFFGMPSSAIATGLVDYVLPVDQMPQALINFVRGPYLKSPVAPAPTGALTAELLERIYGLLRKHTKHDFSVYKTSTLRRRIERRMNVHQIQTAEHYVRFLQEHPYELDLLFQELLIGVTNFFRDPEVFEFLGTTALPQLLTERPEHHMIRAWVLGCSSGEEAYSIAIVLRECMERLNKQYQVQIFATDLSNQAIERARTGLYPEGIAIDVTPARLEHFFVKEDKSYRIKKEIRDMVIFAKQNLLTDPPFAKLDILSCRNLLIYLNSDVQRRIVPLFHYVLNTSGILVLGSSETTGGFSELFTPLNSKWKIFRRKEAANTPPALVEFPLRDKETRKSGGAGLATTTGTTPLSDVVGKMLVQRFAPPSVIITDRGDIVYIHGLTGLFLQPAPGPPSNNVFTMAREGLRVGLTTAVPRAATQDTPVIQKGTEVKTNGGSSRVDITVQKLNEPESLRGLFLVSFQTASETPTRFARSKRSQKQVQVHEGNQVAELEREVQSLRETLQSITEEANTANEELKSANEELQSTNEELQSSNEELESAKEELQSLNEELQTVNSELQNKVEDLSHANDDMQNLLNSTDIATLFLDNRLHIKRFTPKAQRMIKLIPSDVGRPIGDLVSNLGYDRLEGDAQEVLQTLVFKELEVVTRDGAWYLMRIVPYRTGENVIDGLVITFIDITKQKQAERQSAEAQRSIEAMTEMIRDPLVILDSEHRVIMVNRAFSRLFLVPQQEVIGQHIYALNSGQWDMPQLRHLLEDDLKQQAAVENLTMDHTFPHIGRKRLLLNARRLERPAGQPTLILLAMEDITEQE